jgi:hypothetical protein
MIGDSSFEVDLPQLTRSHREWQKTDSIIDLAHEQAAAGRKWRTLGRICSRIDRREDPRISSTMVGATIHSFGRMLL